MATGLSLHLGLNAVDPKAYAGWSGPLSACEFDARDMAALAARQGFQSHLTLTKQATRKHLLDLLKQAADRLQAGDFFFLSYSGHGGQVPDRGSEEADGQDETWCLYDGQLLDDELYYALSRFASGVRLAVLSDSCHSGTVLRAAPPSMSSASTPAVRTRLMPAAVAQATYREHQAFYDGLNRELDAKWKGAAVDPDSALAGVRLSARARKAVKSFKPAALLISGCQDRQTSGDGERNGVFTEALRKVWADGKFKGSHADLHARILKRMPSDQTPNLFTLGPAKDLVAQQAFKL